MKNIMYIAINKDLNMSHGKIAAHTAHAAIDFIYDRMCDELSGQFTEYDLRTTYQQIASFKRCGDTIMVVEASEKELLKWEEEGCVAVRDRGLTEVEPNSITAVCLGIYDKDKDIPKWIQRLRLL